MIGSSRPILHVAALAFPTSQGTQAAIHAMCTAHQRMRETHLLTYARGTRPIATGYTLHRCADVAGRETFRSGPSARKVLLDLSLARALRRLHRELRPGLVVAHHVEAALVCLATGARPFVFFAHTDLGEELPTYAAPRACALLSSAGSVLDRVLCAGADAVATISPRLAANVGASARYVPTPWPVPASTSADERSRARASYGFEPADDVLLYAGNLDAYQGWEAVVGCARALRDGGARPKILIATDSDPRPALRLSSALGLGAELRLSGLEDETRRRAVHACADVAVIPRRTPGGLPIKLLDALARGVPVVAARRATAGLELGSVAMVVDDDDPAALAQGVRALASASASEKRSARGPAYVGSAHAEGRFLAAMDELYALANRVPAGGRDRLHSLEAGACRGTSSIGCRAADRTSVPRTSPRSCARETSRSSISR